MERKKCGDCYAMVFVVDTKVENPFEESNDTQPCPVCGFQIGLQAGSKDAICENCGYKDPCCE